MVKTCIKHPYNVTSAKEPGRVRKDIPKKMIFGQSLEDEVGLCTMEKLKGKGILGRA